MLTDILSDVPLWQKFCDGSFTKHFNLKSFFVDLLQISKLHSGNLVIRQSRKYPSYLFFFSSVMKIIIMWKFLELFKYCWCYWEYAVEISLMDILQFCTYVFSALARIRQGTKHRHKLLWAVLFLMMMLCCKKYSSKNTFELLEIFLDIWEYPKCYQWSAIKTTILMNLKFKLVLRKIYSSLHACSIHKSAHMTLTFKSELGKQTTKFWLNFEIFSLLATKP